MKQYKVIKKWPHGPSLGTIISFNENWFYYQAYAHNDGKNIVLVVPKEEIEEYIEEVKEESFFVINCAGVVVEIDNPEYPTPKHLRWKTREDAENVLKFFELTNKSEVSVTTDNPSYQLDICFSEALNNRPK